MGGLSLEQEANLVGFLDFNGVASLEELVRYGLAAEFIEALGLKRVPKLKAEEFFEELRAARVTATGQRGFSNSDRQDSQYMPDEDSVGRFTGNEMCRYIGRLVLETKACYRLAYHFTSKDNMAKILQSTSLGLRASRGGQLGGGVYVCKRPPHELDWEPFCGEQFRTAVGRTLWGSKWQDVLSGGSDADKLEVLMILEVPADIICDAANDVPERPDITCIPRPCLFPKGGQHYFPKERIVRVLHLTK